MATGYFGTPPSLADLIAEADPAVRAHIATLEAEKTRLLTDGIAAREAHIASLVADAARIVKLRDACEAIHARFAQAGS